MTAVEQLVSNIRELAYDKRHHLGMGDIRITQGLLDELEEQAKEIEKEQSHKYAEFSIRCDRMGMKILNFQDCIKLENFKSE